jgi:hypothetical protein
MFTPPPFHAHYQFLNNHMQIDHQTTNEHKGDQKFKNHTNLHPKLDTNKTILATFAKILDNYFLNLGACF